MTNENILEKENIGSDDTAPDAISENDLEPDSSVDAGTNDGDNNSVTDDNQPEHEESRQWTELNQKIDQISERLEKSTTASQLEKILSQLEKLQTNPNLSPDQKLEVKEAVQEAEAELQNLQTPAQESTPKQENQEAQPASESPAPRQRVWI